MVSFFEKIPNTAKAVLFLAGAGAVGAGGTAIVGGMLDAPEEGRQTRADLNSHVESGGHTGFEEQVTQAMAQLSYRTARTENAMCKDEAESEHYERYCIEVEIMRESGLVVPSGRRVDSE